MTLRKSTRGRAIRLFLLGGGGGSVVLSLVLGLDLRFLLGGGGVSAGVAGCDGGCNGSANKLLNLGFLSNLLADVVKLGAANFAGANDFYLYDAGRVDREHALHANAKRSLSDSECAAGAGILHAKNKAFKNLNALCLSFDNLEVNLYGVSNIKGLGASALLAFFNSLN